ncbi:hypothetical protein HDV06_004350 [Boothiomyces sp. JEL0866]|nr:hypothetical protein HDV06_004350 [Boothiomyces sp. JEL0866]
MEDREENYDESTPLIQPTPLPRLQLFMICLITFVEPVQFGMIFPFVYFMVRDFGIAKNETEIGNYVGLLTSSFCLAQFLTSLPWGWASDRYGRRPILLIGLLGNTITCLLFGFSKTYTFAIIVRAFCGFLNGNLGVVKSMLGELTDETNRGRAFAIWEAAFGLGTIAGPMFESSTKPRLRVEESIETLEGEVGLIEQELPLSKILTRPVCSSIAGYATWALITIIYEEVYALFVAEPLSHGGLEFSSFEIGMELSLTGFSQVFSLLVIYPLLEKRWNKVQMFRYSCIMIAVFSIALPYCSDYARAIVDGYYTSNQKILIFALLQLVLIGKTIAAVLGYIPIMVLVNDSAPNSRSLGTVHGLAQGGKTSVAMKVVSLSALVAAVSAASYCDGQKFCVYGTGTSSSVTITVHAAANGWAGVGIGDGMTSAQLFVGWQNSTKGYTLISGTSKSTVQPTVDSPLKLTQVPLAVPAPSWANLAYSFTTSVSGISQSTNIIWAYSNSPPSSNIDSTKAQFAQHQATGSTTGVNLLTSSSSTSAPPAGATSTSGSDALVAGVALANVLYAFVL